MVSIQRSKDGTLTCISDQNAPVPHSLTKIVTETGNYGLADCARLEHQELALKEGELPSSVSSRSKMSNYYGGVTNFRKLTIGKGRGRGQVLEPEVPIPVRGRGRGVNVGPINKLVSREHRLNAEAPTLWNYRNMARLFLTGMEDHTDDYDVFTDFHRTQETSYDDYVRQLVTEEPTTSAPCVVSSVPESTREAGNDSSDSRPTPTPLLESINESNECSIPTGKSKKGGKTNGYLLFVKHMARRSGETGPVSSLITKYDRDWAALSPEVKADWKYRAKTGRTMSSGSKESIGTQQKRRNTQQTSFANQQQQVEDEDDGY